MNEIIKEMLNEIEKLEEKNKILTDGLEEIERVCIGKYYDNDNNIFLYETSEFARETIEKSKKI